jgi:hypothetical protein
MPAQNSNTTSTLTSTVTGSVATTNTEVMTSKLKDEKQDALDQAASLRTNAETEYLAKRKEFYEKSHNGASLAEDMMKNYSFGLDLFEMWSAHSKFKNYLTLEHNVQSLDPNDPESFAENYSDLLDKITDARLFEQALNQANQMSYVQRFGIAPYAYAKYKIYPGLKKQDINDAKGKNAQEPSSSNNHQTRLNNT